jgi:hypothetical protein
MRWGPGTPSWIGSGATRGSDRLPADPTGFTLRAMIYPRRQVPLRTRIPTVRVTLATDDGEVSLRARWNHRPIDLQRRILFLMRQGQTIFLEDEWGHNVCLRPECVWSATVDGRAEAPAGRADHRAAPRPTFSR